MNRTLSAFVLAFLGLIVAAPAARAQEDDKTQLEFVRRLRDRHMSKLALEYLVVTSVNRDDRPDGGASHFSAAIRALRHECPQTIVEVLIPDFQGVERDLETVRLAFRDVIRGLRKEQGLSVDQLARRIDASPEELVELERDSAYRPTPLMLHKLSRFFQIPQRKLALLAGAIKDIPAAFCQQASSFAAQSESFSKLTNEERKLLDEFVKFLRTEVHEQ